MNSFEQLIEFVASLKEAKIEFRLDCVRDAIMVVVPTPGSYFEIEFFVDGHIESQIFGPADAVRRVSLETITQTVIDALNGDKNSK